MADEYSLITKALNGHLMAFSGDDNMADRVGLENDDFDPEKNSISRFYKANIIWADPKKIGAFTQGDYRVTGEFMISIGVQKGEGSIEVNTKAKLLADHFNRGLVLTEGTQSVKIDQSYRKTGFPEGDFYYVPVTVEFWSYISYQP